MPCKIDSCQEKEPTSFVYLKEKKEPSPHREFFASLKKEFSNALQETLLLSLLFIVIGLPPSFSFFVGWILWQAGKRALVSWKEIERWNQQVIDEYEEVVHERALQEKKVEEFYRLRGVEEPLLRQLVEILTADDYQLLSLRLEQEHLLPFEERLHPLKEAFFAFGGALVGSFFFFCVYSTPLACPLLFTVLLGSFFLSLSGKKSSSVSLLFWAGSFFGLTVYLCYQLNFIC